MIAAIGRASFALIVGTLAAGLVCAADEPCAPQVVWLVRHAEKAPELGDSDVTLSDVGRAHADVLAESFASRQVDAIYATHLRRTQQTVAPLAGRKDLPINVLPASATDRLVARLRRHHCGARVMVAGHSNTVPEIMAALGVREPPAIPDGQYGVVYAVEPGRDRPVVKTGPFSDPP